MPFTATGPPTLCQPPLASSSPCCRPHLPATMPPLHRDSARTFSYWYISLAWDLHFCPKNVWIFRRNPPSNVTTCMSPLLSVIIAVCCPFFLLQKPFFIRGQLNPSQRGEWPPKTKWRGDCCIHSRSKVYINTKQHIIFRNITFFNS